MIHRSGQGGEDKKIENVDGQLSLDRPDIIFNGVRRVRREAEDIARYCYDAVVPPCHQHLMILRNIVLRLISRLEVLLVNTLHPDTDEIATRPGRLVNKPGDLVRIGIDLEAKLYLEVFHLFQLYQTVKDSLPVSIPGKVIICKEEVRSLAPIPGVRVDHLLDIVGGTESRLLSLDVDDGAETTIEGAPSAGVYGNV